MAITIGIDPHKRTHTAVALDDTDEVLGKLQLFADARQVQVLLGFAAGWPQRVWAVENANGLGALLARQLVEAGETVIDVPARLSARVRALSGAGSKTDTHDAHSTAVAGRRGTRLREVVLDPESQRLGLLLERRWHIVDARQKNLVRIHEQLIKLIPGGSSKHLSVKRVSELLRKIRPVDPIDVQRRQIIKDLLAELRVLDRKRKALNGQIDQALADHGTSLTDLDGIGRIGAATIISIVGDIDRFPTAGHFASYTGTAPIEASSGDVVRHRLNRGGKRQLNHVLHTAAETQARRPGPGREYVNKKLAEGKSRKEAIRALKRHLSNAVYRQLQVDAERRTSRNEVSGEDTQKR